MCSDRLRLDPADVGQYGQVTYLSSCQIDFIDRCILFLGSRFGLEVILLDQEAQQNNLDRITTTGFEIICVLSDRSDNGREGAGHRRSGLHWESLCGGAHRGRLPASCSR